MTSTKEEDFFDYSYGMSTHIVVTLKSWLIVKI